MAKRSYQMRSFMKFCRIKGYPTIEGYKILPNKRRQKEAKFLQDYEVQKIIEYAEKNTKHLALIKLFLTTGCRLSEVSSITKDQIENAVKIGNVYQLNIIGKGAKLRSIFPPIETIELCKNLKGNTPIL
jgi:integrase